MNKVKNKNEMKSADLRRALGLWADQMARAAPTEGRAYAALARELAPVRAWSPVKDLAMTERPVRQALFLAAVQLRTSASARGVIPAKSIGALARHFGYDGRGTAGFYRRSPDGTSGLLIRDGNMVRLGQAGLSRIQEHSDVIVRYSAEIEATRKV